MARTIRGESNEKVAVIPADDSLVPNQTEPLSHEERHFYSGRRILITGAGGSIGSGLTKAIVRLQPSRVVLLESSERTLERVDRAVAAFLGDGGDRVVPVLGSILDKTLLRATFRQHRPEIVFHCAALKHVPLLESQAVEAVRHNVLGTQEILEAALEGRCLRFVLVSTDKAVSPLGVMGTTKLLAEQMLLGLRRNRLQHREVSTLHVLRLCNVVGTSGSVVPLFREQIRRGQPVTITSAAMARFFMTRRDAVRLLLRAGTLAEAAGILLPERVTRVLIRDLAFDMLRKAGTLSPEDRIVYTGPRAAEKLEEQLLWQRDAAPRSLGGGLATVGGTLFPGIVDQLLPLIRAAACNRDESQLCALLAEVRRLSEEDVVAHDCKVNI